MSEEAVVTAPEVITPETKVDIAWPPSAAEGGPEAPKVEAEAEPQEVKTVPLAALHEERSRRKEEARRAQESQAQFQLLQRQQVEMMQYMQSQQQRPQMPDPSVDPIGFGLNQNAQTQQEVQAIRQELQRRNQQEQQREAGNNFLAIVQNNEQTFAKDAPDYFEAVNWAKNRKFEEYMAAGMLEHEARQRLDSEVVDLTSRALARGDNPAEVAYRMSKAMGYTVKQVDGAKKLEMQRDGSRASMPSGGSGQGSRLSLDSLMKMGSTDFLAATKGDNWKKLASKLG